MNNYLIEVGHGQKYNLHIKIIPTSANMLTAIFRACPAFGESTKLWLPLDGKTLKLVRKQLDVFSDEEITATKGQLEFPDRMQEQLWGEISKKGNHYLISMPVTSDDSLP